MQIPFPISLAANAAMAAALRHNNEAMQLLAQSNGGLIALELRSPSLSLRLEVHASGVELLSQYDDQPDLQLSASLPDLMALAEAGHDPILDGRVVADGDMALASLLQQLMVVLGSDWEARFAPLVGDTLAHKIGTAARGFGAWAVDTSQRNNDDIGEYLQEEARLLVTRSEWRQLEHSTDTLREDLDRLLARAQRLGP